MSRKHITCLLILIAALIALLFGVRRWYLMQWVEFVPVQFVGGDWRMVERPDVMVSENVDIVIAQLEHCRREYRVTDDGRVLVRRYVLEHDRESSEISAILFHAVTPPPGYEP